MKSCLKNFGLEYLKGIDAVIRLLGTYFIIMILFGALWLVFHGFVLISFNTMTEGVFPWVVLLLSPLIIRWGILAGGFSIPPLIHHFRRSASVVPSETTSPK